MVDNKILIRAKSVVNQQRFPKSRFGWPLMECAKIIIEGRSGWNDDATARMQALIDHRKSLKTLGELYGCHGLRDWSIDHVFVPWFSKRPVKNRKMMDLDYTDHYLPASSIVEKLCALISDVEKRGYIEPSENADGIIGYPINLKSNHYYIRAGNHRAAVLSALGLQIPLVIDNIKYVNKSRDLEIINKRKWPLGRFKPIDSYPVLKSVNCWPAVKSRIITAEVATSILSTFSNDLNER